MLTRQAILDKTNSGLGIYCHILRQFYPGQTVLHLSGRDCGLCCNPFDQNNETLHIWLERTEPDKVLSPEIARHEDLRNSIPSGDVFDFASLYYNLHGQELLAAINEDLHLHIGERWSFNRYIPQSLKEDVPEYVGPCFSYFKAPINNCRPAFQVDIRRVYYYIKGTAAQFNTKMLRSIPDKKAASAYKRGNFDFVTFSGLFTSRSAGSLVRHSGYLCIDFDHLSNASEVKSQLLQDPYLDTQLLFRSPSGDGLKWVIKIDLQKCSHEVCFNAVGNYLREIHKLEIDRSGRDVCRACFLPYDPDVYINPKLL